MRRVFWPVALTAILGVGLGWARAQEDAARGPAGDVTVSDGVIASGACPYGCLGPKCAHRGARTTGHYVTRYGACVASQNCICSGSYKFPVPPQYTYLWPGMYSQKTMTEYRSPWRYLPLVPPREDPQTPQGQNKEDQQPETASAVQTTALGEPVQTAEPPTKDTSDARPEPFSFKIVRQYGAR